MSARNRRAEMHGDVDLVEDLRPAMEELAKGLRSGSGGPGPKNAVSDPTGEAATSPNPFRAWLRRADKLANDLLALANEARRYAGDPLPFCQCGKPIQGAPKVANGKRWHNGCYRADLRARQREAGK